MLLLCPGLPIMIQAANDVRKTCVPRIVSCTELKVKGNFKFINTGVVFEMTLGGTNRIAWGGPAACRQQD
jgi:hypothetical protein